jgi:hypothetical protein
MTDTICTARMPHQINYVVCGSQPKVAAQTMSAWTRREQAESVPQTKTMIGRQIAALDEQIDKLVYELYNLSESEIKVIEGER